MNEYISDRYKAIQDLGINLEEDHVIVPSVHVPRKEMIQQTENSLWVWEKDNPETELLCEGGLLDVER